MITAEERKVLRRMGAPKKKPSKPSKERRDKADEMTEMFMDGLDGSDLMDEAIQIKAKELKGMTRDQLEEELESYLQLNEDYAGMSDKALKKDIMEQIENLYGEDEDAAYDVVSENAMNRYLTMDEDEFADEYEYAVGVEEPKEDEMETKTNKDFKTESKPTSKKVDIKGYVDKIMALPEKDRSKLFPDLAGYQKTEELPSKSDFKEALTNAIGEINQTFEGDEANKQIQNILKPIDKMLEKQPSKKEAPTKDTTQKAPKEKSKGDAGGWQQGPRGGTRKPSPSGGWIYKTSEDQDLEEGPQTVVATQFGMGENPIKDVKELEDYDLTQGVLEAEELPNPVKDKEDYGDKYRPPKKRRIFEGSLEKKTRVAGGPGSGPKEDPNKPTEEWVQEEVKPEEKATEEEIAKLTPEQKKELKKQIEEGGLDESSALEEVYKLWGKTPQVKTVELSPEEYAAEKQKALEKIKKDKERAKEVLNPKI